jgi:hypothetical protein
VGTGFGFPFAVSAAVFDAPHVCGAVSADDDVQWSSCVTAQSTPAGAPRRTPRPRPLVVRQTDTLRQTWADAGRMAATCGDPGPHPRPRRRHQRDRPRG